MCNFRGSLYLALLGTFTCTMVIVLWNRCSFYGPDSVQLKILSQRTVKWMFLMTLVLLGHCGRKIFEFSWHSYDTLRSLFTGCYITNNCDFNYSRKDSSFNSIRLAKVSIFQFKSSNNARKMVSIKVSEQCQVWWHIPVILVTQKVKVGGLQVWGRPWQFSETLSNLLSAISKFKNEKNWGYTQWLSAPGLNSQCSKQTNKSP